MRISFVQKSRLQQTTLRVIDVNQKNPFQAYKTIRNELEAYGAGLKNKAEIIGVTKIDTVDYKNAEKVRDCLSKATKKPVFLISASTQRGLKEILSNLSLGLIFFIFKFFIIIFINLSKLE